MNESIAVDHPHGSEPSSQLRIRFNTRSAKRMIEDNVYPKTVDIPPDALKVAMTTQIAIGNLAEQPVYEKFVERRYITKALQTMH